MIKHDAIRRAIEGSEAPLRASLAHTVHDVVQRLEKGLALLDWSNRVNWSHTITQEIQRELSRAIKQGAPGIDALIRADSKAGAVVRATLEPHRPVTVEQAKELFKAPKLADEYLTSDQQALARVLLSLPERQRIDQILLQTVRAATTASPWTNAASDPPALRLACALSVIVGKSRPADALAHTWRKFKGYSKAERNGWAKTVE